MSLKSFATSFAITASLFSATLLSASELDSFDSPDNVIESSDLNSSVIPVFFENDGILEVDEASFDDKKKDSKKKDGKKGKHSHKKRGHGHKHGHHSGHGKSHRGGKGHHGEHGLSNSFKKMMLLKMLLGEKSGHHGFGHSSFGHGSHGMSKGPRMGFGSHGFGHHKSSGFAGRMHGHHKDKSDHKSKGHHSKGHNKSSCNGRHCGTHGFGRGMHGFGHHELSNERAAIMGRTLVLYSEIQFTDDQKKQFKELFKTHHENSRKQHGDIFKKIHGLMKAASEGKTEEEIKKAGSELGSAIAKSTIKKTNLKEEARKILTADQLKKIDATKAANDLSKKQMHENMKKKFEEMKAKFKKRKDKKEQKKKAASEEKKA